MKKYILFPILVLVMTLASCKTSLEVNDPDTLSLSIEGTLLMPNTGNKIEVSVETDSPEWSFLGGADWLAVSRDGNRLVLTASPNYTLSKRSTPIVVMAGEISRNLMVEQEGGEGQGTSKKNEVTVDQWEDLLILTVETPDPEWSVISSASGWVDHTVNPRKRELRISISENKDVEERTVTFYIRTKSGEGDYEVKVTQRGAMYFVLPYPGFG